MKTCMISLMLLLALAIAGCLPAPVSDPPTGGIQDDDYRQEFLELNDEVGLQVELALASTEDDSLAALQVAQWLESNPQIADYTALPGSIEYTNMDGYLAAVYWTPTDSPAVANRALSLTPTPAAESHKLPFAAPPTLSKQRPLPPTSSLDADCGLPDGTCGCLSNKKVMYYSPFHWQGQRPMDEVVTICEAPESGLRLTQLLDDAASLDELSSMPDFDLVLIESHGGPSGFITSTRVQEFVYDDLWSEYVTTGRIFPGNLPPHGRFWGITSRFVDDLPEQIPGSVVWVGACNTFENSAFPCAFLRKGASACVGYASDLYDYFRRSMGTSFVRSFVQDRASVQDAFDASTSWFYPFTYQLKLRSNVKLCVSAGNWSTADPLPTLGFQSAIGDNNLLAMDILGHLYQYSHGAGALDGVWDSLGLVVDSYPPYPTGSGDVWIPVPAVSAFDASGNGNAWALVGRTGFDTLNVDEFGVPAVIRTAEVWRGSSGNWSLVTHTEDTTLLYPEAFEAVGDGDLWAIYPTVIRRFSYSLHIAYVVALGEGTVASFRGADNGWIVGGNGEVYHWDGVSLQRESRFVGGMAATPLVTALTCGGVCLHRSPMDYDLTGSIFHTFDGERWDQITLPYYEGTVQQLGGVTPSELWWVRYTVPDGGILLEHWDGDSVTVQGNLGFGTPIFGFDMRSTEAGWAFGFSTPNLKFE